MSSNNYKNILLVGATGAVGEYVLPVLLADPAFNVTVLSRTNSKATFPSNVNVIKVDYSDTAALTKALQNQDVVISTVGGGAFASNFGETLVQAALDAHVKWFIPSEFGIDLDDPSLNIPLLASKVAVNDLLKKNQAQLAYTLITTGGFLDWGFDNGFLGFDVNTHTVTLYDDGKNRVSGASLPTIAKAVVGILHNPQLAQNKRVYVSDAAFTQQEALALFEKYTNTKWTVKNVKSTDARKEAEDNLAKGNIGPAFVGFILSFMYGGAPKANFDDKAINKDIGVPAIPLEQIIKEVVENKKNAQK